LDLFILFNIRHLCKFLDNLIDFLTGRNNFLRHILFKFLELKLFILHKFEPADSLSDFRS